MTQLYGVTRSHDISVQLDLLQQLTISCKQLELTAVTTRDQHVTVSH